MYEIKNKRGITLIALAITVAVLSILAGAGIAVGTGNMKSVKDSKLVAELEMVQHAVLEQYTKYKVTQDASYLVGTKLTDDTINGIAQELGVTLVQIPTTYTNADYYRLSNAELNQIGIQNSEDEYIVNYVSGEVINATKKTTSNNQPLYLKASSF